MKFNGIEKFSGEIIGDIELSDGIPLPIGSVGHPGVSPLGARADHVHASGVIPPEDIPRYVPPIVRHLFWMGYGEQHLSVTSPATYGNHPAGTWSFKRVKYPVTPPDVYPGIPAGNSIPSRDVFTLVGGGSSSPGWDFDGWPPVIVFLSRREARELAFRTYASSNLADASYPTIDQSGGAQISPTGTDLLGYLWDLLNVVPSGVPHSPRYMTVGYASIARQLEIYENSEYFTGNESYHDLANSYAGRWVLCRARRISSHNEGYASVDYVDAAGYLWPDIDVASLPRDRVEFLPLWEGWTMPHWNSLYDFNHNSKFICSYYAPPQRHYKFEVRLDEQYSESFGSSASVQPAAGLVNPFVVDMYADVTEEQLSYSQNWTICKGVDWSSLAALLRSLAEEAQRIHDTKKSINFGSYLRFEVPEGVSYLEVAHDEYVYDAHDYIGDDRLEVDVNAVTSVYASDHPVNETNVSFIKYVDAFGDDSTVGDAHRALLLLSAIEPLVEFVYFRWWFDEESCTRWFSTPVDVRDAVIDVSGLDAGTGDVPSSSSSSSSAAAESSSSSSSAPEYSYSSYEVYHNSVTLYASDVDVDDYQYNVDGLDAQVLPIGYKAISGYRDSVLFTKYHQDYSGNTSYILIKDDTTLWACNPYNNSDVRVINGDYGWSAVSGIVRFDHATSYAYAIKSGELHSVVMYDYYDVSVSRLGYESGWTAVSGYSIATGNYVAKALAIRNGTLNTIHAGSIQLIDSSITWTAVTGFVSHWAQGNGNHWTYAYAIGDGRLYRINVNLSSPSQVEFVKIDDNADWTCISGYGFNEKFSGGGEFDPYYPTGNIRKSSAYGIRGGVLNMLGEGVQPVPSDGGMFFVVMLSPDEAVALTRTVK